MNKEELRKLYDARNDKREELRQLQSDVAVIDHDTKELIIREGMQDALTINWNTVRRYLFR